MAALAVAIAMNDAPRLRSTTTRSGSSGCAVRRWSATNAPSNTTLPASAATVPGSPQPSDSPRASPKTSANSPLEAVTVPARSSRGRLGAGTWWSRRAPAIAAGIAKISDTYRHQRQSSASVSAPPSSSPTAPPVPAIAA
jgi:hypothetical protein